MIYQNKGILGLLCYHHTYLFHLNKCQSDLFGYTNDTKVLYIIMLLLVRLVPLGRVF